MFEQLYSLVNASANHRCTVLVEHICKTVLLPKFKFQKRRKELEKSFLVADFAVVTVDNVYGRGIEGES